MEYFLLALFILLPILTYFFNKITFREQRIMYHIFLFAPFVLVQFLLSPFTLSKIISFNIYQILCYLIFFIPLLAYLIVIVWQLSKQKFKIQVSFKELVQPIIFSIAMAIGLVFILFINYTSSKTNNDLNYYINISSNFKYSLYSTEFITVGSYNMGEISSIYLAPQMYYSYAALFSNTIFGYNVVNTLFYLFVVSSISITIFNNYYKKQNYIFDLIIIFSSLFVGISSLYLNANGGNLLIQSLVIFFFILGLIDNKRSITNFFPFVGLAFFSSTAIMTSLLAVIVLVIYNTIKTNWANLITTNWVAIYFLIWNAQTFIEFKSIRSIVVITSIFMLLYVVLSFAGKYYFNKKQKLLNPINFKINSLWFKIFIALSAITIVFATINIGYIQSKVVNISFINEYLLIPYVLYSIILLLFSSLLWKKNNEFFMITIFISLLSLCSNLELLVFTPQSASGSTWRLTFLNLGFGYIYDSIAQAILLIWLIAYYFKDKNFKWISALNKPVIVNKKVGYSSLFVISSLLSSMTIVASSTTIFSNAQKPEITFSSKININTKFANESDIKMLNSIDFKDWSKTFITDSPIYYYLNKATDVSSLIGFNGTNAISNSFHWNYYNFYYGMDYWNEANKKLIDEHKIDKMQKNEQTIYKTIKYLKENIFNFQVLNRNNSQIINSLDFIILNKNTPYFSSLNNLLIDKNISTIHNQSENYVVYDVIKNN